MTVENYEGWRPETPGLLGTVREALDARDVSYDVDEDPARATFRLRGRHTLYELAISVDEAQQVIVCSAAVANRVPEARRIAVCELITRINYALSIGNFEMDMRDGELLFRSGMDVEGGELTAPMVDSLVAVCFSTWERHFPVMMRVIHGGVAPEAALAEMDEGV